MPEQLSICPCLDLHPHKRLRKKRVIDNFQLPAIGSNTVFLCPNIKASPTIAQVCHVLTAGLPRVTREKRDDAILQWRLCDQPGQPIQQVEKFWTPIRALTKPPALTYTGSVVSQRAIGRIQASIVNYAEFVQGCSIKSSLRCSKNCRGRNRWGKRLEQLPIETYTP